jgi:hypothetical protein
MEVRLLLVSALFVAVMIVLVRTALGTPLIGRVMESFQNKSGSSSKMLNTITECPTGSQMYMYEGNAYCCNGILNPDADTVKQTCRKMLTSHSPFVFCTLGPTQGGVKNCLELRAGLLQAEGATLCPPSMPNYCKGPAGSPTENGRCCASATNEGITDCMDPTPSKQCNVGTDPNEFKNPLECAFLREKEMDVPCPPKFGSFSAPGQGSLSDITIYGCSDMSQSCYSAALLGRLTELGYSTTGLTKCSSS